MMLKRKMMAGILAVSLTVGTGTAFAATDAGAQLKTWYDTQFNAAQVRIESVFTNYETKYKTTFEKWVKNDLYTPAKNRIEGITSGHITTANNNIDTAKNTYIEQISEKNASIITNMQGQFDSVVRAEKGKIDNKLVNEYRPWAHGILNGLNSIGDTEKAEVFTNVDPVRTKAQEDLKSVIRGAKTGITTQIESKEGKAKNAVDAHIKFVASEEQKNITKYASDLEIVNKAKITDEASKIQGEALTTMEEMVGQITTTP